jgi:hypothetical protein
MAPPPQPAQISLSPQGESVLAQSLKESVEAQQKVVDRLFDELRDLSRKIEQRQPPSILPITLNLQQAAAGGAGGAAGQPLRPVVMNIEEQPAPSKGLPRYAEDSAAEEAEEAPVKEEPQSIRLEEAPEELETPRGTAPTEAARGATKPKSGVPKTAPVVSEPAPDTRAGDRRTGRDRRTGDDVRRELRDYLNGVRDKLDSHPPAPASPRDLLDYLKNLSDYLPDRDKRNFRTSTERLAIESLKARLAGGKGLRETVSKRYRPLVPRMKTPLSRPRIVDTFSYLKDLAGWLPDTTVAAAMRERLDSLITRMGRAR